MHVFKDEGERRSAKPHLSFGVGARNLSKPKLSSLIIGIVGWAPHACYPMVHTNLALQRGNPVTLWIVLGLPPHDNVAHILGVTRPCRYDSKDAVFSAPHGMDYARGQVLGVL